MHIPVKLSFVAVALTMLISCTEEEPEAQNQTPIVSNPIADQSLEEGFQSASIDLMDVFSDPDGDDLSLTFTQSNEQVVGLVIQDFTLTITEKSTGTTTVTITADDGNGETVSDSFMLAVNEQENNVPTVVSALSDLSLESGFQSERIELSDVFTDEDGDALTFEANSDNPQVVTVRIESSTLIVREQGAGSAVVQVTTTDGRGGMISDSFEVEVAAGNSNPTVANELADLTYSVGFGSDDLDIAQVFDDPDGDDLTYSVVSEDESVVTITVDNAMLTITEVGVGSTAISVTADDGNSGTVSESFMVTVSEGSDETITIDFGSSSGNSVLISTWTSLTSASGYVVVISDDSNISDLTDGDDSPGSTTYYGVGQQRVYIGTAITSLEITLLQDSKSYSFKVFPYSGDYVFDNSQSIFEMSTESCEITSTTENQVCFEISNDNRVISSNQYPSHATGNFPNADPTATQVSRNLTLSPSQANSVTYVYSETSGPSPQNRDFYQFGIATNGVEFHPMGLKPWTNPDTGEENWKWQEQVTEEGQTDLDAYGAHVTSKGNYHYHGDIVGLAAEEDGSRHSLIYGFAGDGFPIYYKYGYVDASDWTSGITELESSYQLKSGTRSGTGTAGEDYPDGSYDGTYIQDFEFVAGLGDLDECNGRYGVTPEYPDGTYYYVITAEFPVTPNCFAGTPDADWQIGQ